MLYRLEQLHKLFMKDIKPGVKSKSKHNTNPPEYHTKATPILKRVEISIWVNFARVERPTKHKSFFLKNAKLLFNNSDTTPRQVGEKIDYKTNPELLRSLARGNSGSLRLTFRIWQDFLFGDKNKPYNDLNRRLFTPDHNKLSEIIEWGYKNENTDKSASKVQYTNEILRNQIRFEKLTEE